MWTPSKVLTFLKPNFGLKNQSVELQHMSTTEYTTSTCLRSRDVMKQE